MKKFFLFILIFNMFFIFGCSNPDSPLTMKDLVKNSEKYSNDINEYNYVEIEGTIDHIDTEVLDDSMKESLKDMGVAIDKNNETEYLIYVKECKTPLTTRKNQHLIIGKKYKFTVNVYSVSDKYHYSIVRSDEM